MLEAICSSDCAWHCGVRLVNVVCAVPVLGGWYRALTVAVYEESDEVLVKFIDYGGYSRLPTSDLKQIRYARPPPPWPGLCCQQNRHLVALPTLTRTRTPCSVAFSSDFTALPFQVVECYLADVKPIDGQFLV